MGPHFREGAAGTEVMCTPTSPPSVPHSKSKLLQQERNFLFVTVRSTVVFWGFWFLIVDCVDVIQGKCPGTDFSLLLLSL